MSFKDLFFNLPKELSMARSIHFHSVHSTFAPSQRQWRTYFSADASKKMAAMLMSAVVAALLVVADQLIDTWTDGHLLVGWVALWMVVFAVFALAMPSLRQLSSALGVRIAAWMRAAQLRSMDEETWQYAQTDYRVMNELVYASTRYDSAA